MMLAPEPHSKLLRAGSIGKERFAGGPIMYHLDELVAFTLMNFERAVDGVSEDEALVRLAKADGSLMNSISWIVGHMAWHWSTMAAYAAHEARPTSVDAYKVGPAADPTPPSLSHAVALFRRAREDSDWVGRADDALLSSSSEDYRGMLEYLAPVESVGTALMRAILHTWNHIGEVQAIRQMLGHPEIVFTGPLNGLLEWRPSSGTGAVSSNPAVTLDVGEEAATASP
jgi:hypothetical protein